MIGRVNSIQSLGTLDGPGVRFVVFFQGCNLRCGCCHNPDTWEIGGGKEMSAEEIVLSAERYKEYFGQEGGITLSGGEPLLQADFAYEIMRLCKERGINTCLDTSGSILNDKVERLLSVTDRVLLDIKYTEDELYRKYVGCPIDNPLAFLDTLEEKGIATTVRQVIIPQINGTKENIAVLKKIISRYSCVDSVELLPFKKICRAKYENMGLDFPFEGYDTPDAELMKQLNGFLNN